MGGNFVSAKQLTAAAAHLAFTASIILRDVASPGSGDSSAGLVDKGGGDPQTIADRRAQRFIESSLKAAFPMVRIVGEEGDLADVGSDSIDPPIAPDLTCLDSYWPDDQDRALPVEEVCVWIDPLDGTREYTLGRFQYVCVLIGVSVSGRAFSGALCEPYHGLYPHPVAPDSAPLRPAPPAPARCMWGAAGVGAHVLGEPGWRRADPAAAPEDGTPRRRVVVTSLTRTTGPLADAVARIPGAVPTQAGGAGHKIARVVEGSADLWVYPYGGTSRWDTCAGEAILAAAGGVLSDRHGRPILYDPDGGHGNADGVIAAADREAHALALAACAGMPE